MLVSSISFCSLVTAISTIEPIDASESMRKFSMPLALKTETEVEELVYSGMRKRFPLELGDAEEERSAG